MDPIGLGARIRAFMWFYFGSPSALLPGEIGIRHTKYCIKDRTNTGNYKEKLFGHFRYFSYFG